MPAFRLTLALILLTLSAAAIAAGSGIDTASPPSAKVAKGKADPAPKAAARAKAPQRAAPGRAAIAKMVDSAAKQYGVEPDLLHAVVSAESGYNPHAVSPAGAVGVMQVMPGTAAGYGVTSPNALFDAQTNIRTGARHLKKLIGKYGVGKAVMAYNAGEGALARHNGFVTYAETQQYTHRVLSSYLRKKGISPYSAEARALTGVTLTPAMASAQGGGKGARFGRRGKHGPLLRRVDVSKLSLRVRPTLSNRALDPAAHALGPDSQPMFVLEPKRD